MHAHAYMHYVACACGVRICIVRHVCSAPFIFHSTAPVTCLSARVVFTCYVLCVLSPLIWGHNVNFELLNLHVIDSCAKFKVQSSSLWNNTHNTQQVKTTRAYRQVTGVVEWKINGAEHTLDLRMRMHCCLCTA